MDNVQSSNELRTKIRKHSTEELVELTQAIIDNIVRMREEFKLFTKMRATTTKGHEVLNVMAYKRKDALKFTIREYDAIRRLIQVADIGDLPAFQPK